MSAMEHDTQERPGERTQRPSTTCQDSLSTDDLQIHTKDSSERDFLRGQLLYGSYKWVVQQKPFVLILPSFVASLRKEMQRLMWQRASRDNYTTVKRRMQARLLSGAVTAIFDRWVPCVSKLSEAASHPHSTRAMPTLREQAHP